MEILLQHIRKYIALSEAEIALTSNLFSIKHLKKGDTILEAGQVCRQLFFVARGLVRYHITGRDKEITIYFSEENTFGADYISFINQTVSDKTIEALEESELYVISFEHMQQFYKEIRLGERFGRLLLEQAFTSSITNIIAMQTETSEQRYLNFLRLFKHLQNRIPQYYIASYIGVTPQSLSRIRRRIK